MGDFPLFKISLTWGSAYVLTIPFEYWLVDLFHVLVSVGEESFQE
jgi:hypothetical protein